MTASSHTPILVKRLDEGVPLPAYEHPGDAGLDLRSRVDVSLDPGQRVLIPTGIAIALPPGYVGLVHPRSGLALKHGLTVVNAPGTIDAGYRGEISVLVINHDRYESVTVSRGDRIAQLVIQQVVVATLVEVSSLPGSHRGVGGYGSTGGFTGSVSFEEDA